MPHALEKLVPREWKKKTPRSQSDRGVSSCRVGRVQRDFAPDRPTRRLAAELDDVLSGRALRALNHVELHGLALGEGLEAVALNGGVMDEAVLLAVRGSD